MKFGIFYEHQLPRPWDDGSEQRLFQDALDQVELADRLGIDYAWEVEHHFLEEYSHSSAPEVFLAAASQRTRHIRLGHGIVLMPPGYNHPARVAERIATLDLVSNGRVELGTGESASRAELEGFGDRSRRAARHVARDRRAGREHAGDGPVPRLRGQVLLDARAQRRAEAGAEAAPAALGGVLQPRDDPPRRAARASARSRSRSSTRPRRKHWVDDYYETFKNECVPIGHAVNPNIAMVTGFSCHADAEEARRRGTDGFRFFQFALGHHYVFGTHTPGRTNIWEKYVAVRDELGTEVLGGGTGGIGTPEQLREHLREFEDAGVDQTVFIQQGGNNRHEHICESLELFADEVMPEFKAREAAREAEKPEALAPYVEAALQRKRAAAPLRRPEIPTFPAYGLTVAEQPDLSKMPEANRRRALAFRRMREIIEQP